MKIILIKYGELTTKKDNRKVFINILYNNIRLAASIKLSVEHLNCHVDNVIHIDATDLAFII